MGSRPNLDLFTMKLRSSISTITVLAFCTCAATFSAAALYAEDDDAPASTGGGASARYGLFNGLDHRSSYGQEIYPEPFLVDDTNKEENEARMEWFYGRAAGHQQNNVITAELSHGFGNVTLQLEVPYEIANAPGLGAHGWDNIDARARSPLFEAVAPNGFADTIFGVALEVGIPLNTIFSKNAELLPQVFNDTRFGKFTIQSLFGYSMLFGAGGDNGGLHTFEYGFTLGYAIEKPCARVERFTPVFEVSGAKELNKAETNGINGSAGFRVNLEAIRKFAPQLGVGYVFPMNRAAHQDLHNGIYTMLAFEF